MSDDTATSDYSGEVQKITAEFTALWESGERPHLAAFTTALSGPARKSLLRELISIDIDFRSRTGEHPSSDDYREHFQELGREELERLTTLSLHCPGGATGPPGCDPVSARPIPPSRSTRSRFRKMDPIGKGGMGDVWKAVQLSTGRTVALKELRTGDPGSPAARAQFEEEIRWASQLQHPHIARVYDSGLLEGSYYYAMELIQGEPLDVYAEKNRWTVRKMLETMRVIAGAMQYAHERDILHLDLKPSNILVDPQGKPVILDFGLARAAHTSKPGPGPRYGPVMGTPAFMAPEQVLGRQDRISSATDIYSLGVIVYKFVTGEYPRKPGQPFEQWQRDVMDEKVRPPAEIIPAIGKNLNALIMKCLEADPADRYPDAKHLETDIGNLLAGRELEARPLNWAGRVRLWCRSPNRLLQAGNYTITLGVVLAPFHLFAIFHGIAKSFGFLTPFSRNLRLREFIPLMIGFLLFDLYMIFSGFLVRRKCIGILWLNAASVLCWLAWFACVLFGILTFDTGGAIGTMAERFPLYVVFMGIALVGLALTCLAMAAYYAHRYLDNSLR